jgi:hypothetical protein
MDHPTRGLPRVLIAVHGVEYRQGRPRPGAYASHGDARRLQRSQGQHDDLACLRRARSGQGCDRRTASVWNGSRPPRRSASRMVPPAPDAWASGAIAPIRTESLPTAVSVAGKRDFRGREKGPNTSPEPQINGLRDQVARTEPRQLRALAPPSGNFRNCVSAWWAREDSNLQPDRYERSALTIELRAQRPHLCAAAPPWQRPRSQSQHVSG